MKSILHTGSRLLLTIALICAVAAACCYGSMNDFRQHAATSHGTVIDMVSNREGGALTYAPVTTFVDRQGIKHTYISNNFSAPASYAIGETVNVYFDPQQPATTAQLGGLNVHFYMLLLLYTALITGLPGALAMGYERWRTQSAHWLVQHGHVVMADLVKVEQHPSNTPEHRPWVVHCQWLDQATRKRYFFRSHQLSEDPVPALANRTKLDVYIDPNNPKKHFVDLSFLSRK